MSTQEETEELPASSFTPHPSLAVHELSPAQRDAECDRLQAKIDQLKLDLGMSQLGGA